MVGTPGLHCSAVGAHPGRAAWPQRSRQGALIGRAPQTPRQWQLRNIVDARPVLLWRQGDRSELARPPFLVFARCSSSWQHCTHLHQSTQDIHDLMLRPCVLGFGKQLCTCTCSVMTSGNSMACKEHTEPAPSIEERGLCRCTTQSSTQATPLMEGPPAGTAA